MLVGSLGKQCTKCLMTTIHYSCGIPMLVGSLCLLGPWARQCTKSLMTTIHYSCGVLMLVGPLGKAVH